MDPDPQFFGNQDKLLRLRLFSIFSKVKA